MTHWYVWHDLLHTATHHIALQRTATHCNALQRTATHCNALQYSATYCNALQRTATHCYALQYTATHCFTQQHDMTHVSYEGVMSPRNGSWLMWICRDSCECVMFYMHRHLWRRVKWWWLLWTRHVCVTWSIQHTATHCSTLQHTATHCNTLQHTAMHCNTQTFIKTSGIMECATDKACMCDTIHSAHCNTLQHTATHCNTL